MLLFTSALKQHQLLFKKLSECKEHLPLAALWSEGEWGYIRNKGVEFRKEVLKGLAEDVYIGTLGSQPVAMFALLKEDKQPNLRKLMYVYVEKNYRGLGFGKQVIEEAKRISFASGADLILLDTLKPSLNRLYEKQGACVVGEGTLFSHPTDVLAIRIR